MLAQNGSPQSAPQSIADALASKNIISSDIYNQIISEQSSSGLSQEEIIFKHNYVDPRQVILAKAQLNNIPFVDVRTVSANPQALTFIPQKVAQHFGVFPYTYNAENKDLYVVMVNPLDVAALDFLRQKSGCRIIPSYGFKEDVDKVIAEKYQQGLSKEVDAAVAENQSNNPNVIDAESINTVIREAPIAKIVTTLLDFAIKSLASDVHIEPLEGKTRVRYRIDGILHEKLVLPKSVHEAVVSRIKILSKMKIDERRLPQDGRFSFRASDQEVDLRVSSLPTVNGEKIVMRVLKKSGDIPTLSELGIRGMALKNLEDEIKNPNGIILVTGPTGSGKTTTLYSAIHGINSIKVNIVTLEDPVEYEMDGINQVQINSTAGLTFASGLRSFLRQDPNVIMVGEIRDQETAELAVQASLTGHLVFSTLHTNSAAGALPRLIDMGIEPFLLTSAINCIVGQRVVRKICEHCKESFVPSEDMIQTLRSELGALFSKYEGQPLQLYRGRKCSQCNDTGYMGRVGVYEVLIMTEKLGMMTISHSSAGELQKEAVANGMLTMKMDGFLKVIEGQTTIEEVLRVSRE